MRFFAFFILFLLGAGSQAQVVINEYSCSNVSGFTDNYGEREDWVELYNPTGSAVSIAGFHMSDKLSNPTKWQIPAGTTVPANGYLRIVCSGRNEVSGGFVHAGFKLTQTKPENLVFADAAGVILENYVLDPTQVDNSRGRTTDGASTWSLFLTPTPGASNSGASPEYTARPIMSMPAGFYSGSITVSITTTDPNATIYYTTDGSEPTTSSTVYSAPISISSTTVLRARGFSSVAGVPASFVESNTYFINVTHTVAVLSIFGDGVDELLGGSYGEPDATVEYFDGTGNFRTEATGIANKHGNDSWAYPQRGIDFVAQDQKGYSYALKHQIFRRKDRDEFQRIIIKAAANDNYPFEDGAHIRDAYVHTLSMDGKLHLDERTYEPAILYRNGEYWGVYDIREKVDDADFTQYYYDQDEFHLQFLKTWGGTWSEYGGAQAQTDWNSLRTFITTQNMAVAANFNYVDSLYNWKSLVDYFILNSYTVCSDWLNWNTAWWRGMDTLGDKQKWRYALWDNDATFGHYINYTGIPSTLPDADPCAPESLGDPGGQGHVEILNELMNNPTFENYYINRWIELTNTTFSCANMIAKLDSIINVITPEMNGQVTKWGGTVATWQANVQQLRDFINARCAAIETGLEDCYNLSGPYTITIDVDPPNSGIVYLNDSPLPSYPYTVTLYGGITNTLSEVPNAPFTFVNWTMSSNTALPSTNDTLITIDFVANDQIVAHFETPIAVFIPTGFSPNGDGLNDLLQIQGQGILSMSLSIYDRWGQRVFSTNDVNATWDGTFNGKTLNSGVFAYKLHAVLLDGTEVDQSGNITLMR
ncbi:MAG: CotH kinase family protein [Flavobacteriales bacterium]|nr:CotH kinase family protein [Flavobacteriales bacterium]